MILSSLDQIISPIHILSRLLLFICLYSISKITNCLINLQACLNLWILGTHNFYLADSLALHWLPTVQDFWVSRVLAMRWTSLKRKQTHFVNNIIFKISYPYYLGTFKIIWRFFYTFFLRLKLENRRHIRPTTPSVSNKSSYHCAVVYQL